MSDERVSTALRRAVLAVTLLDRGPLADLEARDAGAVHTRPLDGSTLTIGWGELVLAAGDPAQAVPDTTVQRRIARWLRLRVALDEMLHAGAVVAPEAVEEVRLRILSRVRPRALPAEHALHPGTCWPQRTVLGGALDVGLALRGFDDDGHADPEAVGLLPASVLVAAQVDLGLATARADRYLQDMATLAGDRLRRDPTAVLRPLGDADVLTLLASREFRTALVDGQGMRSAAIPMRTRGWLDLGRLDPAFALSASMLTEPDERGFPRPVLVTVDEVSLVRAGGDPVRQSLADPAPAEPRRPASRGA
ncbi:MAG: hypothetical protein M0Z98_03000 [Actinomycetales bacterium]|nr:hypothetical protein [Actinomycetales bacterium]